MSSISIAEYFPFVKVKIVGQTVTSDASIATIYIEPNMRYTPVCYACMHKTDRVKDWEQRAIRDLPIASATIVILNCKFRNLYCPHCDSYSVEDIELFEPYKRVTKRLARAVYDLCKEMPVKSVAKHFGLDWKTVKNIDKHFLEQDYGKTVYDDLRIISIDEIAIKKGHNYMTVVLDFLTGRVVNMYEGRSAESLNLFFAGMTAEQKNKIEAVAMDMWDPYIKAVKENLPNAKIVFDMFHVVSAFNKVIDKVRISEYHAAYKKDKSVFKGTKFLLLKNRLNKNEREHLEQLRKLNKTIVDVMTLKDMLKSIWRYKYRGCAERTITEWCALARAIGHPAVVGFAKTIERYKYGILNHCDYPINTSVIEGVNNKIKLIKRKAYGFHDLRYFSLKVIQAFDPKIYPLIGR